MHATTEHARLKAVASPCTAHSPAPGDVPPVYMPPVTSMDRYEAHSEAFEAHMVGITLRNRALTAAARDLCARIDEGDFDLPDIDSLYACVAFAAALTTTPQGLSVPAHPQSQLSEPAGGPCATTVANSSSRGASVAHAATTRVLKRTSLTNTRLWSQTLKKPKSIGLKNKTLAGAS